MPKMSANALETNSEPSNFGAKSRKRLFFATALTLALAYAPYAEYLLYPLRLFVTFIHESGHALAAIATGGSVDALVVKPNGEGVTPIRVSDIAAWISLSGGYLGTAVFGAIMLQVGRLRSLQNPGRSVLYLLGFTVALITLLWGWHDLFTLIVGATLSASLFGMARLLSKTAAEFLAAFLAVQCSLNALGDIHILFNLTAAGSQHNDAGLMAQQYGLPATFWAALWAACAAILLWVSLRSYLRATSTRQEARKAVA